MWGYVKTVVIDNIMLRNNNSAYYVTLILWNGYILLSWNV